MQASGTPPSPPPLVDCPVRLAPVNCRAASKCSTRLHEIGGLVCSNGTATRQDKPAYCCGWLVGKFWRQKCPFQSAVQLHCDTVDRGVYLTESIRRKCQLFKPFTRGERTSVTLFSRSNYLQPSAADQRKRWRWTSLAADSVRYN